ncbi:MAG TPA: NAD(P)-binding protein [Candidatus Agrococcus pullicola]|uniref:NAD(P)-binding protein n=1 Tax=Candidatus Agrococcus pullicola TaxID=2838429 RepID=A0A9D1YXN0_9MICO|nr:NAD(P)-binding protein [Candidatus Agrococcus pullicola]
MSNDRLPNVFSPLQIGPMTVQNRIFSSAHQTTLIRDHLPTPEFLAYHRERARGGTGAIVMEATAVHPSGLLTPKTVAGYLPEIVAAMAEVAAAVHESETKLLTQLFHGGREQIASAPRRPAVGPSAVPTTRFHVEPRALEMGEIEEIIEGYALAASHMQQAGLDGIEISSSHAYLPSQFFTHRSNVRTDRFGPEHPLQFLTEVVDAVRSRVGNELAVGVRLALDEMSDSGLDESACAEVATQVSEGLPIDFISYTMGDSATFSGGAFIAPRPRSMPESILARLPERATGGPVVMATTRVVDIADAEQAISRGLADMVGMTRAQIADPHLVRKAREGEPIIPCTGCNIGCIGHYHAGLPIACTMNQATGREVDLPQPVVRRDRDAVPAVRKRVAILGGGVAGLAAATELAGANAAVTVFEGDVDIGGQLRVAGSAPDHEYTWATWRRWQETLIQNLGIDVRLESVPADADLAGFDDVIDARGAKPFLEEKFLCSLDVTVVDAWSFLRDPQRYRGEHVLVSDWGGEPTGLDCVEVALEHCESVHYAYAGAEPAVNVHQYQRFGYLTRIDVPGCDVMPFTQADVVDDRVVLRGSFSDRLRALPDGVTTVVIAHGRTPRHDPQLAKGIRVGDLDGPRGLEEAALEGYEAARTILDSAS